MFLKEEFLDQRKVEEIWFKFHASGLALLYCHNCEEIFTIPQKIAYFIENYSKYANCCERPIIGFLVGAFRPSKWKSPKDFLKQLKPLQLLLFELEVSLALRG